MAARRASTEPHRVAVLTDSTSCLPADVARRWGIGIVPLDVIVDGERFAEGVDLSAAELAAALGRGAKVSTSQPAPQAFTDAYRAAAEQGAREIVSVHMSGDMSGTVRAAQLAALEAPVPVHVVDSRTIAMGLGFAAIEAARLAAGPGTGPHGTGKAAADARGADGPDEPARHAERHWWELARGRSPRASRSPRGEAPAGGPSATGAQVAERARTVAHGSSAWFLVDSLDHLRRGGRLSATSAAFGTVLGLRPLLVVRDGRIEVAEKVRTRRAARERLEKVAQDDLARRDAPLLAVHHLAQPDVAHDVALRLEAWLGAAAGTVAVCETSAVVAAHAGPGVLAVIVADAVV